MIKILRLYKCGISRELDQMLQRDWNKDEVETHVRVTHQSKDQVIQGSGGKQEQQNRKEQSANEQLQRKESRVSHVL